MIFHYEETLACYNTYARSLEIDEEILASVNKDILESFDESELINFKPLTLEELIDVIRYDGRAKEVLGADPKYQSQLYDLVTDSMIDLVHSKCDARLINSETDEWCDETFEVL